MTQQGLRYLSLFSGVEAATLAWKPLGWKAVAFAEFDAFPSAVLAHHYPDVPNLGDVTKIEGSRYRGTVDLVVGGSPCQGFSVAGRQLGLNDERSGLALAYVRLLEEIRPRWFVWENVPGVLSTNGGEDFRAFIEKITEIGYGVSWRILDAQYVRVPGYERAIPQRRRRLFVVGYLGDWSRAAKVLFESKGLQWDIESCRQTGEGVAIDAQRSLGGASDGFGTNNSTIINQTLDEVAPSILANCGDKCFLGNQEAFSGKYFVYENHAQDSRVKELKEVFPTLPAKAGSGEGNLPLVMQHPHMFKLRSGCEGGGKGYLGQDDMSFTLACNNDQYLMTVEPYALAGNMIGRSDKAGPQGKGYRTETAFTLNTSDVQGVVAPPLTTNNPSRSPQSAEVTAQIAAVYAATARVRKLTPLECERLMGFPDEYTKVPYRGKSADDCPDSPRYKACGNSMCVNVMRWIGLRIQEVDSSI